MPKGKYKRTPKMQSTEGATLVAPPPETPPPDQSALILGLLEKMSGQLSALTERVEAVENAGPRFVKSTPETYGNYADQRVMVEEAQADGVPRSMKIPVTADGLQIPDAFMSDHPYRFGPGSKVVLNLDAVPHGRSDQKTRGELMAERGIPNGYGEVIDRSILAKVRRPDGRLGVWKYRCKFPKATVPGASQGIVSLHEWELLPA